MIKEKQIIHENGDFWVLKLKQAYQVMKSGITHSTCDSAYNDASLARARCNWLAKGNKGGNQ